MNGLVIANPRAGVAARRALEAVQNASVSWKGLELRTTESRGHARQLAEEAAREGREVVIACGGDGTINEVAWGLLGAPKTTLGILPAGSGNGLARALGIPFNPRAALLTLADCVTRAMDVGMINDRPFLNVAGAGFDAAVANAFDEHCRNGGRRGLITYFRVGIGVGLGYATPELTLTVGGKEWKGKALLVSFANGQQHGGGAVLAPGARLDDGQLDVIRIEAAGLGEMLWHAHRMYTGRLEAFGRYERTVGATALLEATGPVPFHRDGEPEPPATRIEVKVLPRALRILVPPARANDPRGAFLTT